MMKVMQPHFGSIIIKQATLDKRQTGAPIATLEVELTDRERGTYSHVLAPRYACAYSARPLDNLHQCDIFGMNHFPDFTIRTRKAHEPPQIHPVDSNEALLDEEFLLKESQVRGLLNRILKEFQLRRLLKTILSKPKMVELGPGVSPKDVRATIHRMLETMNEDPEILNEMTQKFLGRPSD